VDDHRDQPADDEFAQLAADYLDARAERHPDAATELGDHRFDAQLASSTADALAADRQALDHWAAALGAVDTSALAPEHQVDAAMMADDVARQIFEHDELREHAWNPLLANPGRAIYGLLARDFAPLPDRLASVAGRLAGVPAALAAARQLLGPMPKVHLETAIAQFSGTIALVTDVIDAALRDAPECGDDIAAVRPAALDALAGHRTWLSARLSEGAADGGFADPRIGAELFARKLSLTLNTQADADAILARAHADLDRVSEEIATLAAEIAGRNSRGGGLRRAAAEAGRRPGAIRSSGRSSASWPPRRPTTRTSCRSAAARSPHRPPSSGRTGWSRCSTTRSR